MKVSTSVPRVSGPGGRNVAQRCPFSLVLEGQCWQFLHLRQSRRELSQREEILSRESARDESKGSQGDRGDSFKRTLRKLQLFCRRPPTK